MNSSKIINLYFQQVFLSVVSYCELVSVCRVLRKGTLIVLNCGSSISRVQRHDIMVSDSRIGEHRKYCQLIISFGLFCQDRNTISWEEIR